MSPYTIVSRGKEYVRPNRTQTVKLVSYLLKELGENVAILINWKHKEASK